MNIEMFSRTETVLFGLAICLFCVIVLLLYFIIESLHETVVEITYYRYKKKAIKQFKKVFRQMKIETAMEYTENLKTLYNMITEGDDFEEDI